MTKVNEIENDDLRELMTFPYAGLSEYSADLGVQRRVGKLSYRRILVTRRVRRQRFELAI
jgi:hypothetical protein